MSLQQPAVFCNMAGDWPALHWNAKYLSALLDGKTIQFRLGLKTVDLGEIEEDWCYVSQVFFRFCNPLPLRYHCSLSSVLLFTTGFAFRVLGLANSGTLLSLSCVFILSGKSGESLVLVFYMILVFM